MPYPNFPQAPGFGGLLIPFDGSFLFSGGSRNPIIGTVTTAVPGISGGAVIYQPNVGFNVEQAMLNTWIDPPGPFSSAIVYPLLWGPLRTFLAMSAGGAT